MEVFKIGNANPYFPRISGILSPIHSKHLKDCQTNDQTPREGCQAQIESTM
jgi:hypothetical protein